MISGWASTWRRPSTASVANHTIITGPNTLPTAPVPLLCTRNSTTRMTMAMGTIQLSNPGETRVSPSTAASTEMAGVMAPSP